ncbi:MAG: site-2 protease family protein [Candidatus Komeilibacteria bacterium]|jgi:Zn-dependent protease|nr:site-2 protease family protein [Candidatus Komeilibacteria bacterium]
MLISTLFSDPTIFLVIILSLVYALTIHEFSHALVATYLGDNTAKFSGRLNLNPLSHMEFFGTLMLLFAGFGWGKPVPVNPYNLKWRRWGMAMVSLAGPASNFISVAIFAGIVNVLSNFVPAGSLVFDFLFYLIFINFILGIFNLIPIPPLDGSKVLFAILPSHMDDFKRKFSVNGPWVLLGLIFLDRFTGLNIFGNIFGFFINLIYLLF